MCGFGCAVCELGELVRIYNPGPKKAGICNPRVTAV